MDKVTLDKKTEMAMKGRDIFGKVRKAVDDNLTTGLTFGTLIGIGLILYFGWKEIPEAQAEIKRKKEVDPNASDLEIAAAALSKMKGVVAVTIVTGGCVIANKMISDSRLAAATAFGAAAFSDKRALKKELDKLKQKAKLEKTLNEDGTTDNSLSDVDIIEGETVTDHVQRKQEIGLNKIYRAEFDWNERSIHTTPMRVEEVNAYIQKTYGGTAANNYVSKPFSLNTVANLFGESWGIEGDKFGYYGGDDFRMSVAPALDTHTGEVYLQIYMSEPVEDWESGF